MDYFDMIDVLFKYPLKKRLGCVEQHSPANELYSLLRGGFVPIISSTDTFFPFLLVLKHVSVTFLKFFVLKVFI